MKEPQRIFAIDWSGNKDSSAIKKKIWLAEADATGLRTLRSGFKSREAVADVLIHEAQEGDPNFVVGLDFSFSFPLWFVQEVGCVDAPSFWSHAEENGESWIGKTPTEPFYTKGSGPERDPFRVTEKLAAKQIPGQSPDNVFHLVGAKQVGKGSVRGMPILKTLRDAGFSIWPFDPPKLPCVVEIYPRLFYGKLNKSSSHERLDYLEPLPISNKYHRTDAACSDDAFDAAVSALKMYERRHEFQTLEQTKDDVENIEGRIWF